MGENLSVKGAKARRASGIAIALSVLAVAWAGAAAAQQGSAPRPSARAPARIPLVAPWPKDYPAAPGPCAALDAPGREWVVGAISALQAQSLRPNGAPRAREAFAELWLGFKGLRAKGYDLDEHASKIDALERATRPGSSFAADGPFELFKEPWRLCKKTRGALAAGR